MAPKQLLVAQNPLLLRCNRIMDAFAKSDDERDFFLDRQEGFIIYMDLDKPEDELKSLENEFEKNPDRYCLIPKLTFYEAKKIMEGFINEKVYDIDTKEKLLDIIQSKEARENFLEFIYDHHSELEKWQSFYQERSRIRIIEWLRANNFHFVFEEDLEMPRMLLEKVKKELFETKVGKDTQNARKVLFAKAKTYYSNEALNPRPKRGRPPKQIQKAEIEPQITTDIYTTTPAAVRSFLYIPDLSATSFTTFSTRFGNEGDLFSNRRLPISETSLSMDSLNQKLEAIRTLSSKWKGTEHETNLGKVSPKEAFHFTAPDLDDDEDDDEDDFDDDDFNEGSSHKKSSKVKLNGLKGNSNKVNGHKAPKKLADPIAKSKQTKTLPALKKAAPKKLAPAPKKGSLSSAKKIAPKPGIKPLVKKISTKAKPALKVKPVALAKKKPTLKVLPKGKKK